MNLKQDSEYAKEKLRACTVVFFIGMIIGALVW